MPWIYNLQKQRHSPNSNLKFVEFPDGLVYFFKQQSNSIRNKSTQNDPLRKTKSGYFFWTTAQTPND
jgi:hypothetical protein